MTTYNNTRAANIERQRMYIGIDKANQDTLKMRDAVDRLHMMVCRTDFQTIYQHILTKWYLISGKDSYSAPHAWITEQINLHIDSITARSTSIEARRLNQEYAEPEPTRNDVQGI